ncbi:MAG: AgmX/PglI C-terminal domain-containing protein [Deltaproteobacteria bacterium]|nr:AgmX/PglI C-terminal domain-containing protein [Deltaproteobacteria bacterium]
MKEALLASGKWLVVGLLLLLIGILVATGLGRRRATRAYRVRMALWQAVLVIAGGAALFGLTIGQQGCKETNPIQWIKGEQPTCYAPVMPPEEREKQEPADRIPDVVVTADARSGKVPEKQRADVAATVDATSGKETEVGGERSTRAPGSPTSDAVKSDAARPHDEPVKMCYLAGPSVEIDSKMAGKAELSRYVRARSLAIRKCYEQRLREIPTIEGKVVLNITVGLDGKATASVKENGTGDAELATCLIKKVGSWTLPKPEKEFSAEVPFVFKSP